MLSRQLEALAASCRAAAKVGSSDWPRLMRAFAVNLEAHAVQARDLEHATLSPAATLPRNGNVVPLVPRFVRQSPDGDSAA